MGAKLIQVIEADIVRGEGKSFHDCCRVVRQYYAPDGVLLAENDPAPNTTPLELAVIAWVNGLDELNGIADFKGPYTTPTDQLVKLAVELRRQKT